MKNHLAVLLRFLIALLFIVSGFEKVLSPSENFLYVLSAYQVFPDAMARLLSVVFPWVELCLGVFLALGLWLPIAFAAVACLSASFVIVVGQAILRQLPIDNCGCFGNLVHLPLKGVIFLDISILASAIFCLLALKGARRFSLDAYFEQP